jgi:tetratricopeptide (TPR) repeat protein
MRRALPLTASVLAISLSSAIPVFASDPYEEAFSLSREAERGGDSGAAIKALALIVDTYPQDYAVALQLGSLHFGRGEYEEAARAYRLAMARAPAADSARLGLAWALSLSGRCEEAIGHFDAVRAAKPEGASAKDGLASCRNEIARSFTLSAGFHEYVFANHPLKKNATGFSLSASRRS